MGVSGEYFLEHVLYAAENVVTCWREIGGNEVGVMLVPAV